MLAFYHNGLLSARKICRIANMDDILKPIGTFLGYVWRGVLLIVVAIIYLPAFLLTTLLNKPFEEMLKNFGL